MSTVRLRSLRALRLDAVVVYGSLLALSWFVGYWQIFSSFASYDDEGFFDFSLRMFLHGHALYTVVWSTYGPFYYEVLGAVFKIVGADPTTNSGRITQLVFWMLASLVLALVAERLTRRLSIGAATFAAAFWLMRALTNEPMHVEALICLLLAIDVALIVFVLPVARRTALAAIGATTCALVLSKINVGGYAAISLAFAAAVTAPAIARRRVVAGLVTVVFVLLAPAIMISDLNSGATRSYAFLVVASTLALALVTFPRQTDRRPDGGGWEWIGWLLAGALALAVVVIVVLVALGTGFGDFWHLVIVEPANQASFLTIPTQIGANAIWWSLAAVAAAWTVRTSTVRESAAGSTLGRALSASVRIAAGLTILLSLVDAFPFQISPNPPFALAMALAFVAAVPPTGAADDPLRRFARTAIPSLAILQCLLAYPVAGSQVYLAGILLFPCGAICIRDGITELELPDHLPAPRARTLLRLASGLFAALAVGTGYLLLVQQFETTHDTYRAGFNVPIPHTDRLHVTQAQAQQYGEMYRVLLARCSTLISLPALYSFNNWTGLPWPNAIGGAQPFWNELSTRQQLQTLRDVRRSRRLCLIRDPTQAGAYGGPPKQTALVRYLESDHFKVILNTAPYSIAVQRP